MACEFIVITGGPGAGKTAVLEMARRRFQKETAVLPEAASIIFGGGFWRLPSATAKMAAQRAIFQVQKQMEQLVVEEGEWSLGLCDRGTLDGLAYWPSDEKSYWRDIETTLEKELSRYKAVIHLRTPDLANGYNHQNQLRTESVKEAQAIDLKIEKIWCHHPRYLQVPKFSNFLDKAAHAIELIQAEAPHCCLE